MKATHKKDGALYHAAYSLGIVYYWSEKYQAWRVSAKSIYWLENYCETIPN